MSFFSENRITEAGLALLAKGQIGELITYTRIVLGDGYITDIEDAVTEVINPRHEIGITKCMIEDGKAVIGGPLILEDVEEGFYYRELGVYAQDPVDGEILYSYGNAGDMAEWITPGEGGVTERFIELVTIINNASNVTAIIDSNVYARMENLSDYYTKDEVNTIIETVELTPGPKGDSIATYLGNGAANESNDGMEIVINTSLETDEVLVTGNVICFQLLTAASNVRTLKIQFSDSNHIFDLVGNDSRSGHSFEAGIMILGILDLERQICNTPSSLGIIDAPSDSTEGELYTLSIANPQAIILCSES